MKIAEAKAALPLPALLNQLGISTPDKDRFNIKCPLHSEQNGESFSVERKSGAWLWNCFGKCNRGGDEITFVEVYKNLSPRDATRTFLDMAGGSSNGAAPVKTKTVAAPSSKRLQNQQAIDFDWGKDVSPLRSEERVAKERGYSREFVAELQKNGLLGSFNGRLALPVHRNGKVVGVHYKVKDHWAYFPKGTKTAPLVIGELPPVGPVHAFESQWDGFAFMDVSGERDGIVITRGSGNGGLVAGLIPRGSTVYVWPQHDDAGEKWQRDICASTLATVKRVRIPSRYKDLNDWTREGASVEELMAAIANAQAVRQALSPEKLFNDIKRFLLRYIVFSQSEHADVIALWILHTWLVSCADYTPYIYLHSPVMRCGKTQVQRVVEPLIRNPLRTCNVSEAALYREIEESHPTLLWDEIDSVFGSKKTSEANENKRALLNAGHERGMRAIRMERGNGGFTLISFDPFCPKMLAGIGRIPDTIVDRSISILIHRRLKTQLCQKYRRKDRDAAKPLHDALEAWSKDPELLKILRESQPQMPESLTDRQEDIWEPLFAIADSIGGEVPGLVRKAAETLCNNGDDDDLGYGTKYLLAIKKVVGDRDRITSSDLINGLWETDALPARLMEEEEPNYKKIGHWLSKFIKSYGGKPARQLRFDDQNLRGYEAADLKQVFDRYCPPEVT